MTGRGFLADPACIAGALFSEFVNTKNGMVVKCRQCGELGSADVPPNAPIHPDHLKNPKRYDPRWKSHNTANGVNGMKNHIEIGETTVTVYFDGQGHTHHDFDCLTTFLETLPRNTVFTIGVVTESCTAWLAARAMVQLFKHRFNFFHPWRS